MTHTQDTAKLTDADLDAIEVQMDDTVAIYVPTLVRELREARAALAAIGRYVQMQVTR